MDLNQHINVIITGVMSIPLVLERSWLVVTLLLAASPALAFSFLSILPIMPMPMLALGHQLESNLKQVTILPYWNITKNSQQVVTLIMAAKPVLAISILIMELVMPIPMLAIYIFKFICFENNNLVQILCRNKYFEIHSIINCVPLVIKSKKTIVYIQH